MIETLKKDDGSIAGIQATLTSIDGKLPATVASEATLATLATEATVATLATEATVATLATEATLASVDGKLPAAAAAADAESNATTMTAVRNRNMVFNGNTWDRIRGSLAGVASAVVATWTGFLHVLGFGRYVAARPTLADGEGTHLQVNTRGDLATQEQYLPDYEDNDNDVAWTGTRAINSATGAWTRTSSGGTSVGTAGVSIKAAAGRVKRISVTNKGGAAIVAMIKNKATAMVAADTPDERFVVPAGGSNQMFFGESGMYFSTGIALGFSRTAAGADYDSLTLLAANDAHYTIEWY